MKSKIQKWGNSNAIRIPKHILDVAGIKENDEVDISSTKEGIIVKKEKRHLSFEERMLKFYSKPLDQIEKCETVEYSWDSPKGEEIW